MTTREARRPTAPQGHQWLSLQPLRWRSMSPSEEEEQAEGEEEQEEKGQVAATRMT